MADICNIKTMNSDEPVLEIPKYPCHTCSYFDMLVCMSCEQSAKFESAIEDLKKVYNSDIAEQVRSLAIDISSYDRLAQNISMAKVRLNNEIHKFEHKK